MPRWTFWKHRLRHAVDADQRENRQKVPLRAEIGIRRIEPFARRVLAFSTATAANGHSRDSEADWQIGICAGSFLQDRLYADRMRGEQQCLHDGRIGRLHAGRTIAELPIRKHGCSVVAIARNGAFITRLSAQTKIELGDELYVCGNAEALKLLEKFTS